MLGCVFVLGVSMKRLMITKRQSHPMVIGAAIVSAVTVLVMTAPARAPAAVDPGGPKVPFAAVKQIMELRCTGCHATKPTISGIAAPPNGLVLESPAVIRDKRELIKLRAVTTKTMPLGNLTAMTDEERKTLERWIDQGAAIE